MKAQIGLSFIASDEDVSDRYFTIGINAPLSNDTIDLINGENDELDDRLHEFFEESLDVTAKEKVNAKADLLGWLFRYDDGDAAEMAKAIQVALTREGFKVTSLKELSKDAFDKREQNPLQEYLVAELNRRFPKAIRQQYLKGYDLDAKSPEKLDEEVVVASESFISRVIGKITGLFGR